MELTGLIQRIHTLAAQRGRALVAIDGGAAAGKSTLAAALGARLDAGVFHMDDFFLPPELRTLGRLMEPGGNVHRERFLSEVLLPLAAGRAACFRPFDCAAMGYGPAITAPPRQVSIVEGAYSHHPDLAACYDLRVFLAVSPGLQRARILARNGAMAARFFEEWIPMENRYFQHFSIQEQADFVIEVTE